MTKVDLKASIAAVVKNNPVTKLRGNVLQAELFKIVDDCYNAGIIENTKAALDTIIATSGLEPLAFYKITDRGDVFILLQAISTTELSKEGIRKMLCPTWYGVGTDEASNTWIGEWHPSHTNSDVAVGNLAIRAGLVWRNLTGNIGTAPDAVSLDATNWELVPKDSYTNFEYTEKQFPVIYDYENDWIQKQYDGYGNIVGFPANLVGFQPVDCTSWNSTNNGGVNYFANASCLLGFFNNRGTNLTECANNTSKEITGCYIRDNKLISANKCNSIKDCDNTGDIIYNLTPMIQNLDSSIGDVKFCGLKAGTDISVGIIDGQQAPFTTWVGDILEYDYNGLIATDNTVPKLVGVSSTGETKLVDNTGDILVELGTFTYSDLNSLPADAEVTFTLPNEINISEYFLKGIEYNVGFAFVGGKDLYLKTNGANKDTDFFTAHKGFYLPDIVLKGQPSDGNYLPAFFDVSFVFYGGDVNPQDYISGTVIFYAHLCKFKI